jgi:hypothetical protein
LHGGRPSSKPGRAGSAASSASIPKVPTRPHIYRHAVVLTFPPDRLVTSEFIAFIRKDSWRGLREKFLSLAFVKMQNVIARDVLDAYVTCSAVVFADPEMELGRRLERRTHR